MILYRPVGAKEHNLIQQSCFKKFPPRLPEQPILSVGGFRSHSINLRNEGFNMIFENPSKLTYSKMQELIGKNLYDGKLAGCVTQIDYSRNCFGFVDGYKVRIHYKGRDSWEFSHKYPGDFNRFDLKKSRLATEFIEDINEGLKRIRELEEENDKKVAEIVQIPFNERINHSLKETDVLRVAIGILTAFDGGCEMLLNVGSSSGDFILEINSWTVLFANNKRYISIQGQLTPLEVEAFYTLYRSFDFFGHKRKTEKMGFDGATMFYNFYDRSASRYYSCWCPDRTEDEFEIVRFMFKFLEKYFTDETSKSVLEKIKGYFYTNEA